jgi:hypothetical protein
MNRRKLISENNRRRSVIRNIVRDIITVYKDEDDGEFYLPNHLDDNDIYIFPELNYEFVVELVLQPNDTIDTFKVDANLYQGDNIIEIIIDHNPKNKNSITYDLVGELNEIIAHEIRHIDQYVKGTHELGKPEKETPIEYYTQGHELDAQVFGFRRLAKLTKTPFDVVVKRWFKTHKDIHKLSEKEMEIVINKILNYK